MATRALSADATRASSEIPAKMDEPSRRSVLSFVAVAGAVVAAGSPAVAMATVQRPWDRALARYEHARDAAAKFSASVYDPAWDRIRSKTGKAPSLTIEHIANSGRVAHYYLTPRLADGGVCDLFIREEATARVAAYNDWAARTKRAEAAAGWDQISADCDRLDDAEHDARTAMMREPAPDVAALAYKLRLALEGDELWDSDREALRRDADRILL